MESSEVADLGSELAELRIGRTVHRSATAVIDELGNVFLRGALDVVVDGTNNLVILDAEQTEIILKVIRVAEYGKRARKKIA